MHVLFSLRNFWYIKTFDSVIRELASRGHTIDVRADPLAPKKQTWDKAATELAKTTPGVTVGMMPWSKNISPQLEVSENLLQGLAFLRLQDRRYATCPSLGIKARQLAPELVKTLTTLPLIGTLTGRLLLRPLLARIEASVPIDPAIETAIETTRPDLLMVSPLVTTGSSQVHLVRAARQRGTRTIVCAGSWDHLSSKGLVRPTPDLLLVWNKFQALEATEMHQIPADRVAITGAQCFDHWFGRNPSRSREIWLNLLGLPQAPYILYVCSSLLAGSPPEAPFVQRWIRHIRKLPALKKISVVIRPHPKRLQEWKDISIDDLNNVVIWPLSGAAPLHDSERDDFFDSLYHSSCVVGINTTALIEAGIAKRPVHSIMIPEFKDNQEGTLHFRYLLDENHDLIKVAHSLNEHAVQLAQSLSHRSVEPKSFLESFVRPLGITRSASDAFVDAIEAAVKNPPIGPEPTSFFFSDGETVHAFCPRPNSSSTRTPC